MLNVPEIPAVAEALSISPTQRYVHPSVEQSDALALRGVDTFKPPSHQLFWRINSVKLLHNFDGLFDRKNEVALVAITVDSNVDEPIQFSLPSPFVGVEKDGRLPIGDSGLGMYYSQPRHSPHYLGLSLFLIEDDKAIRELGATVQKVRKSKEYEALLATSQALASAANPAYGALITVTDSLVGLTARMMKKNKDDLVAYFAATYTRDFDGLGLGKHVFHQPERARVRYEILAKPRSA